MHVCMYVGRYVCMHVGMCACMYVCIHVRMYVCMYVCIPGNLPLKTLVLLHAAGLTGQRVGSGGTEDVITLRISLLAALEQERRFGGGGVGDTLLIECYAEVFAEFSSAMRSVAHGGTRAAAGRGVVVGGGGGVGEGVQDRQDCDQDMYGGAGIQQLLLVLLSEDVFAQDGVADGVADGAAEAGAGSMLLRLVSTSRSPVMRA